MREVTTEHLCVRAQGASLAGDLQWALGWSSAA